MTITYKLDEVSSIKNLHVVHSTTNPLRLIYPFIHGSVLPFKEGNHKEEKKRREEEKKEELHYGRAS